MDIKEILKILSNKNILILILGIIKIDSVVGVFVINKYPNVHNYNIKTGGHITKKWSLPDKL